MVSPNVLMQTGLGLLSGGTSRGRINPFQAAAQGMATGMGMDRQEEMDELARQAAQRQQTAFDQQQALTASIYQALGVPMPGGSTAPATPTPSGGAPGTQYASAAPAGGPNAPISLLPSQQPSGPPVGPLGPPIPSAGGLPAVAPAMSAGGAPMPTQNPLMASLGLTPQTAGLMAPILAQNPGMIPQLMQQAQARNQPLQIQRLQQYRDTLPVGSPERAEVDSRIASLGAAPAKGPQIQQLQAYRDSLAADDPRRAEVNAQISRLGQAPSTTVSLPATKGETEEAKTVGEWYGKQFTDLQDAGTQARAQNARLDRLGQLLDETYTGAGAETALALGRIADRMGFDIEGIPEAEAGQALASEMALQLRNPAGGAGMPGAMSDRDREFLQSMVPGLAQTKEGRDMMIETQRKLNNRSIEVARRAREYRRDNGRLDEGFFDELAVWSEENPLFGSEGNTGEDNVPAEVTYNPVTGELE